MNFNTKILMTKIQVTTNVDPLPTGSNVVVAEDLNWSYYEGDKISRNRDKSYLGADEELTVVPRVQYDFSVELSQVAAVGNIPAFGHILRACGMAEVNNPGVDTRYTPVSQGFEELAAYFIDDQEQQQIALNCKGSFGIELNAKQLPKISFSGFIGTYQRPAALGAAIVPNTTAWEDAVPVSQDSTVTLTIDGYQGCVESFSFDINNNIIYRDKPGCKATNITDRDPSGTIVLRAPTLATKDFFAIVESHVNVSKVPIAIVHGDGTRPNLAVNLPSVQLTGISRTEVDGELFYTIPYKAIASAAGNDEIELIF